MFFSKVPRSKNIKTTKNAAIRAIRYSCTATATPIAAATQSPAAVVSPLMPSLFLNIAPAPKKPTPIAMD